MKTDKLTGLFTAFFLLTSVLIRWTNTVGGNHYLLMGGDGPYYPLQVRHILQHNGLAFPDMPLLFYIQAFIARLMLAINMGTLDECVLAAVRLCDAILPAFAVIPVLLISRELRKAGPQNRWSNILMTGFSVLNFSTLFLFFNTSFQKNAFAVTGIFFFMYFILRLMRSRQKKFLYLALLTMFITAITHFGSFSVILLFCLILLVSWLFARGLKTWALARKPLLVSLLTVISLVLVVGLLDPGRMNRLLSIPGRLFETPLILLWMKGQMAGGPVQLFFILVPINALAVIALIALLRAGKNLETDVRIMSYALLILALILCCPLLGIEWILRLGIMGYIPVTVLYLILLNRFQPAFFRITAFTIFILLASGSMMATIKSPYQLSITEEAFREMQDIPRNVELKNSDVVIARHDLRWLSNWIFNTRSSADYLYTAEASIKQPHPFILRQHSQTGFTAHKFREPAEPDSSALVYKGRHFELYRLIDLQGWNLGKGEPPIFRGTVVGIDGDVIKVRHVKSELICDVILSQDAVIKTIDSVPLRTGQTVEIWGKPTPFSLDIRAQEVVEIPAILKEQQPR